MADQIDPFLDGYYSLRAEYWRIGIALWGMVEGDSEAAMQEHLATRLALALESDAHSRAITDRLTELGLPEALAAQEAQEHVLTDMHVSGLNPARLRLVAEFADFPPLPEVRSLGLTSTIQARLSGSVGVGVVGAVIARRVVNSLLRRGVLQLGARALLATIPLVGTGLAIGTDAIALTLEEHFNRADFRAEILAALEAQRAAVLQGIDAAAEVYPHPTSGGGGGHQPETELRFESRP